MFFALGLRVVSMVDALTMARGERASRDEGISFGIEPEPGGFRLSMSRSF